MTRRATGGAHWRTLLAAGLLLAASAAVWAAESGVAPPTEPLSRIRIATGDGPALAEELERAGFDVLEGATTRRSVDVIVSRASLRRLREKGLHGQLIARGRPLRDILAERGDPPPGYSDYDEVLLQMQIIASDYPDICQYVDVTALLEMPQTYEGRRLYALKISDNAALEEDEPAFLLVSCHHARELTTPVQALYAAEQFTSLYGLDPDLTEIVDSCELWIAPVWNPDGYQYVFDVDNMWRKNRRVFAEGIGVDQNRNYPQGWYNGCSGSTNPSSEIYKGPEPASEAETQTMIAWSRQQHFERIIDNHNYGREVLRGYACWSHPFDDYMNELAVSLSIASGYGGAVRDPSADGEHYQWQFAIQGAWAHLIECATDFQPSYQAALDEAALVFPGVVWMLQQPTPLWGYVTDAVTGDPVEATIDYEGVVFQNDETNQSFMPFGRYHAFLPAGTYDVVFEADGYDRIVVSDVVISDGGSTRLDVQLRLPPEVVYPNGGETLPAGVETIVTWTGDASLQYQAQYTPNFGDIAIVNDDFESGVLDPAYTTGGDAVWYVSTQMPYGGDYSARAGVLSHNQESWMTRTVEGGDVGFFYRVSSENNYDWFNFYIDAQQEIHVSGESGWQYYSATLPEGDHLLKWEYTKDSSQSNGFDTAWIDDLQLAVNNTQWLDIVALTDPGVMSWPWTPTEPGDEYKVRVRSYNTGGGFYGVWDESDATFSVTGGIDGDVNGDGVVNVEDLLQLLTAWGPCPDPPAQCPEDINGDGAVNTADLLILLANWGSR